METLKKFGSYLVELVAFSIGYLVFKIFGWLSVCIFLLISAPSVVFGWFLGGLIVKKDKVDKWYVKLFNWLNFISWIFPIFGYINGALTLRVSRRNKKNIWTIISILGLLVTIINSSSAIWSK